MGIHEGNKVAGNKFSDEILTLRDRLFFGLTGCWQFPEKAIDAACLDVRFQLSRTVAFEPK